MQIKQVDLHVPSLAELSSVIQNGLQPFFENVSVNVKPCPNLSEPPFGLTSQGLSGNEAVLDIGGVKNLLPLPDLTKTYAVSDVIKAAELSCPCFTVGAGAGPFHVTGKNCELVADCSYSNGAANTKNRIIGLDDKDEKSSVNIGKDDQFGLMLNLFASSGDTGEVLEIICENRRDDSLEDANNFANRIRKVLLDQYGPEKPVGLGGVILFEKGTARLHVMPGFSKTPLNCQADLNSWLRFFEVEAPLVVLGELVSHDPGLNLRLEHFHCFKPESATDGGHFHTDTTPKTARYRAYFNVAKRLVRVEQPQ